MVIRRYFKNESIEYSFEFLTKVLNIDVERIAVTVFVGDDKIPKDTVSANKWIELGINPKKIAYLGVEDNFWIAGESGPCGSDTEIFYFRSNDEIPDFFDPSDNRWVEIWNNVFMQYFKDENGNVTELPKKNVDTGMGVERVAAILEDVNDNYLSSVWIDVIKLIEQISNKNYEENKKDIRIIADHIRTATFILGDNAKIVPSNTDRGYILRRLIRRAIRCARNLEIANSTNWEEQIANLIIEKYAKYYDELSNNKEFIITELAKEKSKFSKTLEKGLRVFEKETQNVKTIDKDLAFKLYDTFGFPIELTEELAKEKNLEVDIEGFKEKFKAHQELSRTASKGMFKGGLAGDSQIETRYHTATHLLNAALKKVLNGDVHQKGSNITNERMRFDFSFDRKLTKEELDQVENLVNEWIKKDLIVTVTEENKMDAVHSGAEAMFIERYPDIVTVYTISDRTTGEVVSKEICMGPHVEHTSEIGKFKITKEEASSAGVRRIKAVIE